MVRLTVECYDEVKRKAILKWFRKSYGVELSEGIDEDTLLGDENCSQEANRGIFS